jgi:hypothetical protein
MREFDSLTLSQILTMESIMFDKVRVAATDSPEGRTFYVFREGKWHKTGFDSWSVSKPFTIKSDLDK